MSRASRTQTLAPAPSTQRAPTAPSPVEQQRQRKQLPIFWGPLLATLSLGALLALLVIKGGGAAGWDVAVFVVCFLAAFAADLLDKPTLGAHRVRRTLGAVGAVGGGWVLIQEALLHLVKVHAERPGSGELCLLLGLTYAAFASLLLPRGKTTYPELDGNLIWEPFAVIIYNLRLGLVSACRLTLVPEAGPDLILCEGNEVTSRWITGSEESAAKTAATQRHPDGGPRSVGAEQGGQASAVPATSAQGATTPEFSVPVKTFAPRPLDELLDELASLVGLPGAKAQVRELVDYLQGQRRRQELGIAGQALAPHLRFQGAPGTGKTTVARLVAEIMCAIGLLPEAKLVEVGRGDLVGGYQGHTAAKTNAALDEAIGGVLFIDEAYALRAGNGDTFGEEALNVLVARLENDRGAFVCIIAGYARELAALLAANPGLRSRFDRAINFEDYTASQLVEISELEAAKSKRELTPGAAATLEVGFADLLTHRDDAWANGREARRVVELAVFAQSQRQAPELNLLGADELTMLTEVDALTALQRFREQADHDREAAEANHQHSPGLQDLFTGSGF